MEVIAADSFPDVYSRTDPFALPISKLAAGSDLSFTVPNGLLWNVVSVTAKFTASAAAANRAISLNLKDENGTLVYTYTLPVLTANQTQTLTFSEDVVSVPSSFTTGGVSLVPLPSTWFPSLWNLSTSTANIDTGDTWTAVGCWVQAIIPPAGE